MNRNARLLQNANRTQLIVEIGAGYTPIAPKADGWRTHVVDHATREELKSKYSGNAAAVHLATINTDAIEEVDTVWRGGPLDEALPADLIGNVDLILASHVLEHIPDLLGFLQSASRLVNPAGMLSIALPDRRFCFDCFRPWSTTGDLLDAHHAGLTRHSLRTAFNHMAYSASADGQLGWKPGPTSVPLLMDPFETAARVAALFKDPTRPYDDYHAWQFTPAGFRLIMLELVELGASDWAVEHLESSDSFEFFALLRRGATPHADRNGLQTLRRDLLLTQLLEVREQINLMVGNSPNVDRPRKQADATYEDYVTRLAEIDRNLGPNSGASVRSSAGAKPNRGFFQRLVGRP